jgi:hypothetical protein
MREPAHPEAFPEHLRPYLFPMPETQYEALFLLSLFPEPSRETRGSGDPGLHDRILGVEGPAPVDRHPLRADLFSEVGG